MKKLTLEHLAGYLPYGLKVKIRNHVSILEKVWHKKNTMYINTVHGSGAFINNEYPNEFKPILRPLSDLTKEIEVGGEKFVPTKWIFGESLGNPNKGGQSIGHKKEWERKPETWKYYQLIHLFKWHFDIFGLIEEGLAIDINTL